MYAEPCHTSNMELFASSEYATDLVSDAKYYQVKIDLPVFLFEYFGYLYPPP